MVRLSYVSSELRRRGGRTLVTAIGLAMGVGLVVAIVGVSTGLSDAQGAVLKPLQSVGTDLIVTRTLAPTTSTTTTTIPPTTGDRPGAARGAGAVPGQFFASGDRGVNARALNAADSRNQQLISANRSVLVDLSKLGKPGTHYTHDFFVPGTLVTFPAQAIGVIGRVSGVSSAIGALSLQGLRESGTVPKITASFTTGGEAITKTLQPPKTTPAEQAAERSCISKLFEHALSTRTSRRLAPGTGGPPGGRAFRNSAALGACLTPAERAYQAKVIVPRQTIERVISPPTTNLSSASYTVAGVDVASRHAGIITTAQVVRGGWFTSPVAHEVLVARAYAASHNLSVGKALTVNGTAYKVVGIVEPSLTGDSADVYFSLGSLEHLASLGNTVNEVFVRVDKAASVGAVERAIKAALPGATVLTSAALADKVSGSLASAHRLTDDFGGALAVIVLLAAFLIAMLLTLSSVAKRVREIGTLRAIGWTRGRVVAQIATETLAIGAIGAALGIGLGAAACAVISAIGPSLSVQTSGLAVGASALTGVLHPAAGLERTVQLDAPLRAATVLIGIAGAVAGGLVAGLAGGLRAARLVPAEALRDLG